MFPHSIVMMDECNKYCRNNHLIYLKMNDNEYEHISQTEVENNVVLIFPVSSKH